MEMRNHAGETVQQHSFPIRSSELSPENRLWNLQESVPDQHCVDDLVRDHESVHDRRGYGYVHALRDRGCVRDLRGCVRDRDCAYDSDDDDGVDDLDGLRAHPCGLLQPRHHPVRQTGWLQLLSLTADACQERRS